MKWKRTKSKWKNFASLNLAPLFKNKNEKTKTNRLNKCYNKEPLKPKTFPKKLAFISIFVCRTRSADLKTKKEI